MSQDNGYTTFCSRCGSEVNSNARYCMKCGNLNPDHPDNKGMSKFINTKQESYQVGSGKVLTNINANATTGRADDVAIGDKMGSFTMCFLLNFGLFILLTFGAIFFFYVSYDGDVVGMITSYLPYYVIGFSVLSIELYSAQLVFMKMNKPWWAALIPFYNFYVIADAIYGNNYIRFLTLIPVVGQIISLYLLYKMGDCFKKSKLSMLVLPFIMLPIVGFGESSFYGTNYVGKKHTIEQEYKMKKMPLSLGFFYLFLCVAAIVYVNTTHLKNEIGEVNAAMFVKASDVTIREVSDHVSRRLYQCSYPDNGTFYLHFDDIASEFDIPFSITMPIIEAYVKVVPTGNDRYDYYISMTDGTYGFDETLSKDVDINTITYFHALKNVYDDGNDCYLR